MILNVITKVIEEDTLFLAMLFADDLVLCEEIKERIEERIDNWRGCCEYAGLKVSRQKDRTPVHSWNCAEYLTKGI